MSRYTTSHKILAAIILAIILIAVVGTIVGV